MALVAEIVVEGFEFVEREPCERARRLEARLGGRCALAGLEALTVSSVEPGSYGLAEPSVETPEFLVVARRPS